MVFFPYSAKNTPERFPYITISLIVINAIIYLITANLNSHSLDFESKFLSVRPEIIKQFALSWATMMTQPWRIITSCFLHGDIFHLLGNMVVLWVFGPAVEGRLGQGRYIGVYLLTGGFAGVFQSLVAGVMNPQSFVLGASGAIMGLAGAYLWIFPFATVSVALLAPYFRVRSSSLWRSSLLTFDWHAQWAVLYLFVCDLWAAIWSGGYGGVANFAHVGGMMAGLGTVALLNTKRDGRRVSEARKQQSEGVNLSALSAQELADLLVREPENAKLILAYGQRVADISMTGWEPLYIDALNRFGQVLSEQGDAKQLAVAAGAVSPERARLPVPPILRICARIERTGKAEDLRLAAQLYKTMFKQEKTGPDAEMSLLRYAQVTERLVLEKLSDNPNEPVLLYQTLLRRFPSSPHIFLAQESLKRLGASLPSGF